MAASYGFRCRDCNFIDDRGQLDKCPYCCSDDWEKLPRRKMHHCNVCGVTSPQPRNPKLRRKGGNDG